MPARAPRLAKLRAGFNQDAFNYLLFLRLVPAFPFWFVNIAPAILGVPLRTYLVTHLSRHYSGNPGAIGGGRRSRQRDCRSEGELCNLHGEQPQPGRGVQAGDRHTRAHHQGNQRWRWCFWDPRRLFPLRSRNGRRAMQKPSEQAAQRMGLDAPRRDDGALPPAGAPAPAPTQSPRELKPDLCVIGGGSGGLSVAAGRGTARRFRGADRTA